MGVGVSLLIYDLKTDFVGLVEKSIKKEGHN